MPKLNGTEASENSAILSMGSELLLVAEQAYRGLCKRLAGLTVVVPSGLQRGMRANLLTFVNGDSAVVKAVC